MNLGFFTMPIHPLTKDWRQSLREDREAFLLADELGFVEAYVGEHVTDAAEQITSCAMFIASLASEVKNMRLGTGTVNMPNSHPANVSAQVAMLDHMLAPCRIVDLRGNLTLRPLKRPKLPPFLNVNFGHHPSLSLARIGRAHFDPGLEVFDHVRRQLALGRHCVIPLRVGDGQPDPALVRLFRNHARTGIAALAKSKATVQSEPALVLPRLPRVAFVTGVLQNRQNLRLEKRRLLCGGGCLTKHRAKR